ncbi:peptidoglycan DD-metalloendopeptidase family protein [Staphylococcus aureus]|uniref:peptidoglycan DD-metalloendopeptidase family protein n=1 Tax=Staphylococcus aureus TaxID=1280 RepID=UPI0013F62FA1|nr:peptidoglycan DD-metalloendopeptidase family protein [Staphylococcus aureus]NHC98389.1 peptidoglycan DD-metalloendopeptidase family protein [Staphylococcus aureus]NHE14288.1 peptidoglycan DD-metalloendopeptidase family protein [Staphylococcus aureus]
MAERIKGLQIDLSMRDMGVSKTLAGIKREFRSLNSSLKLSSNNFKYGEKSASSYKARMNDLDKSIKVGTSNLNELEKQYKQVAQSQGANSAKAVRLQTEYNKQANAINAMQDEYGRLNQYYRENFSVAGRLSNSFRGIGTSMQSVGNQAQNMGRSLTSSITKPALIAGTAMAGITAKLGFDRLVGLDSAKAKLEGLGYSTKEVGSITDQVSKAIEGGMTTMAEGTDVAAGALAAGVKEGKELEKYIKLVGDAAVGSNRPVGEMAMIFNRVQGQGKLMTQELNMVEEGMPGFSNAMAKHLGVSYDAFREMVTNGEVSSKEFLTVMDDFAGGMANAYSKSWKGMMQNTKAYIGMIGESLLGGVFEQSKDSLHEFEKMLKSPGAQQWAKETGEKLGSAFSKLANGIKGIINWWQSLDGSTQKTLGGMVKWLGITLVTMGPVLTIFGKLASTIGGMFSGMSSLIQFFNRHNGAAKVSAASQAIWNGVTTTARGIANGYRAAMTALTTSQTIQAIKSKIAATAMTIWTGVTKAAALATRGLGLAIRFMTGPVGIVITVITALVGAIIHLWKTNSTFRNAVISIWNSIKAAAIAIFGFIKPYIINIWNAIKNSTIAIWNAIKRSAVTIWNAIKFAVQHPIQALKKVLSALWNGMKTAAIKIWTLLKNGVLAIIKAYVTQVRSNFNLVKRIVLTIFNAIKSFSIKVWNVIKNGILNIVRILRNGIDKIFKGIKNTVTTIFNAIKNFSIKVWNTIKNSVINRAKGLWNGVRNTFNALKKGTTAIFNAVKNFALKVWTSIKNSVISRAKALWSGVRNAWNNLKKGTTNIFKSVGSFMSSKWNSIKTGTVNKAKALWSGVKGAWGSLSKGTRNTMNSVGSFMSKKWKDIKSGTVDIVTGMKDKITGVMNKMGDGIKGTVSKIKGFFTDMIGKVKGGLNKLIEGVNFVGKKLGMDKIDPVNFHTGTTHTQTNLVKNGKISQDTMATVGDKGKGNGPGGFRHETIIPPKGKPFITPARDTTMPISKGTAIMNGAQTHAMLSNSNPEFASGTIPKFAKGTKKDKNIGDYLNDVKSGTKDKASDAYHGVKDNTQKALEASGKAIGKGKKWLGDAVGDVMDWIDKPGKLFDKIIEGLGLNMSSFGIPKSASLPFDMMKGMFGKLKKSAIDLITGWMEDAAGGEGDASWLLKHDIWQKFGAYTGGLGFNGGKHYGVDFGMTPGTSVKAVAAGKVSRVWNDYGGGKSIEVDLGKGLTNWYMHLSKQLVKKGQKVGVGDLIAKSGNTGAFTAGSGHLHFQLNKNGQPQSNVLEWLKGLGGGGKKAPSKWKSTIKKAAKKMKVNLSGRELNGIVAQIARESNGDAGVTQGNIGDINNLRGTPAQGLLQYVPSTFKSYAVKGHGNIKSGYDQLLAFFNNKNWRRDLPYGKSGWGPSGGRKFATGGLINSSGWYNIAEGGHPEFVIPTDPSRQSDAMKLLAIARQRIEGNKKNKRPNQMRTPSTGGNNSSEIALMKQQLEATKEQNNLLMQLLGVTKNIEGQPKGFTEKDVSQAQGNRARIASYNLGL